MTQQNKIKKAVLSSFELDYGAYYALYRFKVTVSESAQSTRAEKVKLALTVLKELEIAKDTIFDVRQQLAVPLPDPDGDGMRTENKVCFVSNPFSLTIILCPLGIFSELT